MYFGNPWVAVMRLRPSSDGVLLLKKLPLDHGARYDRYDSVSTKFAQRKFSRPWCTQPICFDRFQLFRARHTPPQIRPPREKKMSEVCGIVLLEVHMDPQPCRRWSIFVNINPPIWTSRWRVSLRGFEGKQLLLARVLFLAWDRPYSHNVGAGGWCSRGRSAWMACFYWLIEG